eukprot:TRINITY_DN5188_c0_g1_i9.p1 TRINITY_DN5188_c0_g1~~TRINITY_DN5188_c0_g1_i9.p1  ORF type:complete len:118 (-),score=21.82 TRINITY_DN5188_c0_g1_i9:170-523(-)
MVQKFLPLRELEKRSMNQMIEEAITLDWPNILDCLLINGFPHHLVHHRGTPLQSSCFYNRSNCVDLLLKHGADPNQKEPTYGQTSVHIAIQKSLSEILNSLLRNSKIPYVMCQDKDG